LVDANLVEIKLLSPMYIFGTTKGIPDEILLNPDLPLKFQLPVQEQN
jgi:hypothetical protein